MYRCLHKCVNRKRSTTSTTCQLVFLAEFLLASTLSRNCQDEAAGVVQIKGLAKRDEHGKLQRVGS